MAASQSVNEEKDEGEECEGHSNREANSFHAEGERLFMRSPSEHAGDGEKEQRKALTLAYGCEGQHGTCTQA
ncbi:MAG: hypothetical protein E6R03_05185 [Hyphomicrobiaceae bacterium]|nr:MAG: hypothetical protein E6R03_05185 [Hyphomicrobiaceae bacterium]